METLINKTKEYLETRLELIHLKLIDKSSGALSTLIVLFIVFAGIQLFILMLCIGVALYLDHILENDYIGFLIVAASILLIVIIVALAGKKIQKPIQGIIVNDLIK